MPIILMGEGYVKVIAGPHVMNTVELSVSWFVPGFGKAGEVDIAVYSGKDLVVKLVD